MYDFYNHPPQHFYDTQVFIFYRHTYLYDKILFCFSHVFLNTLGIPLAPPFIYADLYILKSVGSRVLKGGKERFLI
ncbi:transmembrane protein, putative [Medicago truncatula]|uniref:Transmembrane protein, putative n=1 Tax=Medicago truncatula TaxID=3880 RepID=G7J4G8_MEDTR|nr:transmembrane protein, putative [Medicago truncatula]